MILGGHRVFHAQSRKSVIGKRPRPPLEYSLAQQKFRLLTLIQQATVIAPVMSNVDSPATAT
jgi:hypothetical protein